jgi:hypothetical protein
MSDEKALEQSGIKAEPNDLKLSYFPVSVAKLVVMNCCTLGAYQYYWFYENWQLIKKRECLDIQPFWRTFFAVVYCFPLFGKIEGTGNLLNLRQPISPDVLAGGWVLLSVLSVLPEPYWLVTFLSVVFLVPVQQQINLINERLTPGHDPNKNFSAWNILAVVLGGSFFILAVIVTFVAME